MKCRRKKCSGSGKKVAEEFLDSAPVYCCVSCGAKWAVSPRKRGQPVKHPEGPATARMELRLPEAIKAKIARNGGTEWVTKLVREAKEKDHGAV